MMMGVPVRQSAVLHHSAISINWRWSPNGSIPRGFITSTSWARNLCLLVTTISLPSCGSLAPFGCLELVGCFGGFVRNMLQVFRDTDEKHCFAQKQLKGQDFWRVLPGRIDFQPISRRANFQLSINFQQSAVSHHSAVSNSSVAVLFGCFVRNMLTSKDLAPSCSRAKRVPEVASGFYSATMSCL